MPIKQVTCCKCNTLVNKAVTYSIGKDQRACKTHEGVVETRGKLEVERFQKNQATISAHKQKFSGERRPSPWSNNFGPKCWVCMNEGLRQDEFFTRALIELEKAKIVNPNMTPLEMLAAPYKALGRCIFVLSKDKATNALKYVREDFMTLVTMSSILAICGPCCGTLKIDPLAPTPDLKHLALLGVAYETSVQPMVKDIAVKELAAQNNNP